MEGTGGAAAFLTLGCFVRLGLGSKGHFLLLLGFAATGHLYIGLALIGVFLDQLFLSLGLFDDRYVEFFLTLLVFFAAFDRGRRAYVGVRIERGTTGCKTCAPPAPRVNRQARLAGKYRLDAVIRDVLLFPIFCEAREDNGRPMALQVIAHRA